MRRRLTDYMRQVKVYAANVGVFRQDHPEARPKAATHVNHGLGIVKASVAPDDLFHVNIGGGFHSPVEDLVELLVFACKLEDIGTICELEGFSSFLDRVF